MLKLFFWIILSGSTAIRCITEIIQSNLFWAFVVNCGVPISMKRFYFASLTLAYLQEFNWPEFQVISNNYLCLHFWCIIICSICKWTCYNVQTSYKRSNIENTNEKCYIEIFSCLNNFLCINDLPIWNGWKSTLPNIFYQMFLMTNLIEYKTISCIIGTKLPSCHCSGRIFKTVEQILYINKFFQSNWSDFLLTMKTQ